MPHKSTSISAIGEFRNSLEIREAHYDPDSTIVGKLPLFKCPYEDCRALLVPCNLIPSLNLHSINRPKCLVLNVLQVLFYSSGPVGGTMTDQITDDLCT